MRRSGRVPPAVTLTGSVPSEGVSTDSLDDIRDRLIDAFRAYLAAEQGPERAIAVKKAAELLADAREHFYDSEGLPDLTGRSYDYRVFVGEAINAAGVPKAERNSLTASIRFQISPILHERHGEELAARGLDSGSTRDRARARRRQSSAILNLFGKGSPIRSADDIQRLAELVTSALERVRPADADVPAASEVLHQIVIAASEAQQRVTRQAAVGGAR